MVLTHRNIWIAASDMVKVFGEDAAMRAAIRADAMAAHGDEESYAFWARTVRAIDELRGLGPVSAGSSASCDSITDRDSGDLVGC